jgi:tRNA1(Val) A37 N6-methylase TrmN6
LSDAAAIALTADAMLGGRLTIAQPAQGFRSGSDAVWLAAAVAAVDGQTALDVGCGVGAAALCLAARVNGVAVTGLERDAEAVALAVDNARRNHLADRVRIVSGDINAPPAELSAGGFDHVFANPPYFVAGRHSPSPLPARAAARGESEQGDLRRWIEFMLAMARPGGALTLILRAERVAECMAALAGRAGDARVLELRSQADKPPKRVLIAARKGSGLATRHLPALVLHGADGRYTPAAEAVLRHGAAVDLSPEGAGS